MKAQLIEGYNFFRQREAPKGESSAEYALALTKAEQWASKTGHWFMTTSESCIDWFTSEERKRLGVPSSYQDTLVALISPEGKALSAIWVLPSSSSDVRVARAQLALEELEEQFKTFELSSRL